MGQLVNTNGWSSLQRSKLGAAVTDDKKQTKLWWYEEAGSMETGRVGWDQLR